MIGFIRGLNFPRVVILLSLVASGVIGWFVYEHSNRLEQIQRELVLVKGLVQEIQTLGYQLNDLQKVASGETLKGEDYDADTYVREIAADPETDIGQVKLQPSVKSPYRDVEDHINKITPATKTQKYTRGQIGNFLYKLEADSRRVKVTSLKLTPFDKIKPGEIGNDRWTFEASITTRQKVEE